MNEYFMNKKKTIPYAKIPNPMYITGHTAYIELTLYTTKKEPHRSRKTYRFFFKSISIRERDDLSVNSKKSMHHKFMRKPRHKFHSKS
jgi:hypothetical protein